MKSKLFVWLLVVLLPVVSWAQVKNNVSEVRDYRVVDGKIIITCVVNGMDADFVLDLAGHPAILPRVAMENSRTVRSSSKKYRRPRSCRFIRFLSGIALSLMSLGLLYWKMNLICGSWALPVSWEGLFSGGWF